MHRRDLIDSQLHVYCLIEMAISKNMEKSTTGDQQHAKNVNLRSSSNAWVMRGDSNIVETLFKRSADLLNVHEKLIDPLLIGEPFHVVKYEKGQKYDFHHDWGVEGIPNARLLTLLIYLNNQEEGTGGETVFPLAEKYGLKVRPVKGNAILFYNLLEDGNADELTLHSGAEVQEGTKWVRFDNTTLPY